MKEWNNYYVLVFDKEGYITNSVNNLDSILDAALIVEDLIKKYSIDYSIEIYNVVYHMIDSKHGTMTKKEFKEKI